MQLTKSKILALFLLPFVVIGAFFVYQKTRVNEIYAVDPLVVTYNGDDPPNPIFELNDIKPGDTYERCFKVRNNSTEPFSVEMSGTITLEEKNFSHVLEFFIDDQTTDEVIFQGLMKDLFTSFPINLGNFTAGSEQTYCIKVYFPKEAENEYQEAKAVFDIIWRTELPNIDIPPECEHLRGKIKSVIYGTEGNDKIYGNVDSNLIFALGGNDKIYSGSGDDCVVLGDGNNIVYSESGYNVILGGSGNNKINLGSGNDIVYGGSGNDNIDTGSGDDLVYGGDGNDNIDTGSGNDIVYGGNGNDTIRGGSGDDYLDGGPGHDTIKGDSGIDTCLNGPNFTSCEIINP